MVGSKFVVTGAVGAVVVDAGTEVVVESVVVVSATVVEVVVDVVCGVVVAWAVLVTAGSGGGAEASLAEQAPPTTVRTIANRAVTVRKLGRIVIERSLRGARSSSLSTRRPSADGERSPSWPCDHHAPLRKRLFLSNSEHDAAMGPAPTT
ncbi:MAG: hypothetical protein AB8G26_06575 [Ilumatobacter sp.]